MENKYLSVGCPYRMELMWRVERSSSFPLTTSCYVEHLKHSGCHAIAGNAVRCERMCSDVRRVFKNAIL